MIGIVLTDSNGRYRDDSGALPQRPAYDKPLLLSVVAGKNVLCSPNTYDALPGSIKQAARSFTSDWRRSDIEVNLGISTFDMRPPELMLVIVSKSELGSGPTFRLPANYRDKMTVDMQDSTMLTYTRKNLVQ